MKNGYIDAMLYVMFSSFSFVFLDRLCSDISPVSALFIMSGIAILFFNLVTVRLLLKTYKACFLSPTIFFAMAAFLALDWVSMVYASHVADPFIAMAALFISLAIISFMIKFFRSRDTKDIISLIILIFSLIMLLLGYKERIGHNNILGVLLGAIAGIAFYGYITTSEKFAKKHKLTSLQVLATRFWVLLIGSAVSIDYQQTIIAFNSKLPALVLISFCSLIIPIYFNQQAIVKLGALKTSVIISLVPPVTYFFYIVSNHQYDALNTFICALITLALFLPTFSRSNS